MTISSETRKAGPFIGAGTLATYPFTFKVFSDADLVLTVLDTTSTVETTLVINSDYTVTLNADQNASPGGTITLTAGNLATGKNLVITSDVAYLQPTDLTNQGGFFPQVITTALDRLTVLIQQVRSIVSRGIRQPVTDATAMADLPSASERANKVLTFDADGNPIAIVPASGSIAEFAVELANDTDPAKGAGLVGYGYNAAYPDGTIGKKASESNVLGDITRKHISLGVIPRCTDGVFAPIDDAAHHPLNVTSLQQLDQYNLRVNYSFNASKINTFIAAPDAELAPFGIVCGGDVGTTYANIKSFAPLRFYCDNNSPTPNIITNSLWQRSVSSGNIALTRVDDSTLRVSHPPSLAGDCPQISVVNGSRVLQYVTSFSTTSLDIICMGDAAGYIAWNGAAFEQQISDNLVAPTLTWTPATGVLRVDHGTSFYGGSPSITGFGGTYIPQIVNLGATYFELSFYDYAGVKQLTANSNMQFFYRRDFKVKNKWPSGEIVNVDVGLCAVPTWNFSGVTGNNLWVTGTFEY